MLSHLIHFFYEKIRIQKYCNLLYPLKIVFTLNHGQANVERSFSVNKAIFDTNMNEISIVSHRIIKDHLSVHDLHPHTVAIINLLLLSCKYQRGRNTNVS